mgnify:FL=1
MKNNLRKNTKKAFTLVELLISMVIFVIFLGVVSSSYISIVRAQKHANEVRKIYSDIRTFVDTLNEEIRLSSLDYDCYEGRVDFIGGTLNTCEQGISISQGRSDYLSLMRKDGLEKTLFYYNRDEAKMYVKKWLRAESGWITAPGFEDGYRSLLSDIVKIENFAFAISPDKNPYSSDPLIYTNNSTQFQPKVTIFLTATSRSDNTADFHFDFQTTISSRIYTRKL